MNKPEKVNLSRVEFQNHLDLGKTFKRLIDKYADEHNAAYHAPHGVAMFCSAYFERVFIPEMIEAAEQKVTAEKAATDDADSGEHVEGMVSISPLELRGTFCQGFEMLLMIGYEFGRQGHSLEDCTCIADIGADIEAAMHKGTWEQGLQP